MVILEGVYSDQKNPDGSYVYPDHIVELTKYVQSMNSEVNEFSGLISIVDGRLISSNITVINARSIAESIIVTTKNNDNDKKFRLK